MIINFTSVAVTPTTGLEIIIFGGRPLATENTCLFSTFFRPQTTENSFYVVENNLFSTAYIRLIFGGSWASVASVLF